MWPEGLQASLLGTLAEGAGRPWKGDSGSLCMWEAVASADDSGTTLQEMVRPWCWGISQRTRRRHQKGLAESTMGRCLPNSTAQTVLLLTLYVCVGTIKRKSLGVAYYGCLFVLERRGLISLQC